VVKKITRHFLRTFLVAAAFLVIVYAVVVVTAREMLPIINRYQPQINAYLSKNTGLDFTIDRLSGLWRGLTPSVELENVVIASLAGDEEALYIDRISAELNTAKTVTNLNPVWRNLTVGTARLSLKENEDGQWTLGGHPLGEGGGGNLDTLKEMLYYSRLLHIDTLDMRVHYFSGAQSRVRARNIQIANSDDFHRVTGNLYLDSKDRESASFVFEGRGDPANVAEFKGQGYLNLERLNLEGSLSAVLARLFPRQVALVGDVQTDFGLEFWFDWASGGLVKGRGTMAAEEIPLRWLADTSAVHNFSANFSAWFTPGEDWGFQVNNLKGEWHESSIEPLDFQLRQGVGRHWGNLELATSYLNLTVVKDIVEGAGLVTGKGLEVLQSLNPSGHLSRVFLDVNFNQEAPAFSLRTNLEGVAIEPWLGAPAARGISGFLSASADKGYLVLDTEEGEEEDENDPVDSFAMHYHQAFPDFMTFGATSGKVAWQVDSEEKRVFVTTNKVEIDGEEGQGSVFLHLNLPFEQQMDPQMFLMVGLKKSHSRFLSRYLPEKAINSNLNRWLQQSVGDAIVDEAGFIWRGSLQKDNAVGRSIQVYSKVRQGRLDYQQGWPALQNLSAKLVVNNTDVDAWGQHAKMGEAEVENLAIQVRKPGPDNMMLRVAADASSPVAYGLRVLADSPLQLDRLKELNGQGEAKVTLDLRIPLSIERHLEDYRVSATIDQGRLQIPGSGLHISQVNGELNYSLGRGLYGRNLEARFLENRVRGDLRTGDGRLEMDLASVFDTGSLGPYIKPFASFVEGKTPVTGRLVVPLAEASGPAELNLSSTLVGVSLYLPEPLGKASQEQARWSTDITFGNDSVGIDGSLEYRAAFALNLRNGELDRGEIQLLAEEASLPDQPGLLISGAMDRFVWSDWQPLLSGSAEGEPQSQQQHQQQQQGAGDLLTPRLDLAFGEVEISDFVLGAASLQGFKDAEGWHFRLSAKEAEGEIVVPEEEGMVPKIDLDYLRLPSLKQLVEATAENSESDLSTGFGPQDIPEINFRVKQLDIGDKPWGSLGFQSRLVDKGILFGQLEGDIRGIQIKAQDVGGEGSVPAELRWIRNGVEDSSMFSGTLELGNVEEVLNEWGAPAPLSSDSAAMFAEMSWQGKPWDVGLLELEGYLGLEIHDGQFYKAANAGANTFFKLVSLVNFDTWLRRLRFDFSDLFSSGVSFDLVEGGLLFDRGKLLFDEPLVASMPSGKIRLMGGADLTTESLNARLVATMPVGTNLPWVAGLLGGLPAAAGVYLTSKIFEKQVDQLSSLSYRIEGSFDDPEVEVERIFTDPTETDSIKED